MGQLFPSFSVIAVIKSSGSTLLSSSVYKLIRFNDMFVCLYVVYVCLLYTSDAADEGLGVALGGRRIIKKKK